MKWIAGITLGVKYALVVSLLFILTACGDKSLIVSTTKTEVLMPPEEITMGCPSEIDRVSPSGPQGRYTESDTATIVNNNRVGYVACRSVIQQLKDYYADAKARVDKINSRK